MKSKIVVLACIGLMAVMCGCAVGDNKAEAQSLGCELDPAEEELRAVVVEVSSWLEPYLINGSITEERDNDTIYLKGRVGEITSIFSTVDITFEVSKEMRRVSSFGFLPTVVQEEQYESMTELISRGEKGYGLSPAWLVLDDAGHIRCQSWASFDSILHNAEETRVNLVGSVLDKLLSFSSAVAAVEIGYAPVDAMPAIGRDEPFQDILGGHHFGKEDDVKYIMEKCYDNDLEVETSSEGIDPWWRSLPSGGCDSRVDFIYARMEEVTKDIGGRYDVLPYTLIVRDGMVWSVCVMPDICPEEKRSKVAMELMKINFELSTTLLHMDFDTGRIWSSYSLATSTIRDEECMPPNDLNEAFLIVSAVKLIADNSDKIYAAFSSKKKIEKLGE